MRLCAFCSLVREAGQQIKLVGVSCRQGQSALPSSCPNEVDSSLLLSNAASMVEIWVSFVFVSFSRSWICVSATINYNARNQIKGCAKRLFFKSRRLIALYFMRYLTPCFIKFFRIIHDEFFMRLSLFFIWKNNKLYKVINGWMND